MLPRAYRLLKSEDFRHVYQKGQKHTGKYIVLYVLAVPSTDLKIGFVASKKVGKAYARNRVKRQAREAVHQKLYELVQGHRLVFVLRKKALYASYEALQAEIDGLLKKGGLL